MANLTTIGQPETNFISLGSHCEIRVTFLDKRGKAPVTVSNPSFKILKEDKTEVNLRTLKPLAPTGKRTGEYKVSFLSDGLTSGRYLLNFTGWYPDRKGTEEDNKIEVNSEVEIFGVDGVQVIIDLLRNQLHDHVPEQYKIDNPEEFKWEDGDLYNALNKSLSAWNSSDPPSQGNDVITRIEDFPFLDILLLGGEWYALNQEGILEIWNTMTYSDDITFTLNRFPMLMQKLQMVQQMWLEKIKTSKKVWAWQQVHVRGIKSMKLPVRALRQLSMTPQLSFLSSQF